MKIIVNKHILSISKKGFVINRLPGQYSGTIGGFMPRSRLDYGSEVGTGRQSAIIMACVAWAQRTYPEAPLMLEKIVSGEEWEQVATHQFLTLLESPNQYYDGLLISSAMIADWMLDGNAYFIKGRSKAGRVVELWWAPSFMMEPYWDKWDNTQFIRSYRYSPGGMPVDYLPEDIIHFRNGIDPDNTRKGRSALKSLFREVFTDDEAANMTATLLKNLGVPGVVISPETGGGIGTDDAEATKAWFKDKFTGDYRGEPLVMSGATKVTPFTFSPQQMDLKALRRIPEERISGVLGIPAIVAGLGAGLDRSTFANFKEAREAAYESMIIPTQRIIGAALKRQLLRDFEDDIKQWRVGYDLSDVRILQEDENALSSRTIAEVQGGILKIADSQRILGLPVDDTQDFYLRKFTDVPTPSGAPVPPEPEEPPKLLKKSLLDEAGKEIYWKGFVARADLYEKQFKRQINSYFNDLEKEALESVNAGNQDDPINLTSAKKNYADRLSPVLTGLAGEAVKDAERLLNLPSKSLKQADFQVNKWLEKRIPWAAAEISEETAKLLRKQLADGFNAGESIPQLSKRVRGVFMDMKRYRSDRIARTEIIATSNQAALSTYQENGVSKKEWLAAYDERTRETHLAAHGQVVGINENFRVGNDEMPAPGQGSDPAENINCRCAIIPVIE